MPPKPEFGAVRPDNVRPRPTVRRDPDDTPAPPPTPTPTPAPAAENTPPPPAPPVPDPVPAPPPPVPQEPVRPAPPLTSAVAPATGGTLDAVLTAPHHQQRHTLSEGVAALAGLAGMAARPVDPMEDWAADGTRTPRWLAAAVRQYAGLTGRKTQEVQRDALLGVRPIPEDVLDAQWFHFYGFPREQYNPASYR